MLTQRRFEEAEKSLGNAIELDPDLVDAAVNLAVALMNQRKSGEAEQQLLTALAAAPRHQLARVNLRNLSDQIARAAFDSENWQRSGGYYSRAIQLFLKDAEAHFGLAKTYLKLKKPILAKKTSPGSRAHQTGFYRCRKDLGHDQQLTSPDSV